MLPFVVVFSLVPPTSGSYYLQVAETLWQFHPFTLWFGQTQ